MLCSDKIHISEEFFDAFARTPPKNGKKLWLERAGARDEVECDRGVTKTGEVTFSLQNRRQQEVLEILQQTEIQSSKKTKTFQCSFLLTVKLVQFFIKIEYFIRMKKNRFSEPVFT